MDVSAAILKRYLTDALAAHKGMKALRIEIANNPRFHSDAIRIMRDNTEVMRIFVVSPNIMFQRTVPRYVGERKTISAADPAAVDKIIAELYNRPWESPDGNRNWI